MWNAEVYVTFKRGVLDPQGKAVHGALADLGYHGVEGVRVGKYIQLQLKAASEDEACAKVDEMCRRLLANTVIEEYRIALSPVAGRVG
jgi:phosphoribosylformylglycinamidine synthase